MENHCADMATGNGNLRTWLFNPFHYLAGGTALAIGLVAMFAAGAIGGLSNSHFDGVLDLHTGATARWWFYLYEVLVAWLALAVPLFLAGKLISKSRVRAVDVFGTQALARFPTLVTALALLLPGCRRFSQHLTAKFTRLVPDVGTMPSDIVAFSLAMTVMLVMIVWMVALMYRAFSVSGNVKGGKAIGFFIACLLIGEALSKLLIISMHR